MSSTAARDARPAETQPISTRRVAIAGAYFAQGLLFLTLTTRLPRISQAWDIGEGTLSLFMLMMVLLAGLGSFVAERIATNHGSRRALRFGFVFIALGLIIAGMHVSLAVFGLGMAVYGVGLGIVDAASNMQAVALEHEVGHTLLPSFHGAWTMGGIVGTVLTLMTPHLTLWVALGVVALVPLGLLAAPLTHTGGVIEPAGDEMGIKWRPVVLVGLALVLFYMVDTAATTWGATYVHNVNHSPESLAPLATLPYLVTTVLARFSGDGLTERLGAPALLRAGALVAFAALAVIVFSPHWVVAVAGFALLGVGVAVIAPLSFSTAAAIARDGGSADPVAQRARVDAVIARFNQFNYAGALLGSVLTGALGAINLRIGFAVPLVLVLAMLPLAKQFRTV